MQVVLMLKKNFIMNNESHREHEYTMYTDTHTQALNICVVVVALISSGQGWRAGARGTGGS